MNPRRLAMVEKSFKMLDKNGSGDLIVEDIREVFDVSRHPDCLERKANKE